MLDTCKEIVSLMIDMAEEGVEKARIKAQQNRLLDVMLQDKRQLDFIYSRIGRIDVAGGDKKRRESLVEEAKKLEARILKAKVRYDNLKAAASVDECTKAFEDKLADTVNAAKVAVVEKANDAKNFAKEKGSEFAAKASAKAEDISIKAKDKAADLSIKAKDKAADISEKAKEKAKDIKEKSKAKADKKAEKKEQKKYEKESKSSSVHKSDEEVLEEYDDILKRIEDAINSVDEESAEEFKF